ncbi:hypothetical protein BJ508DRAFT_335758 [Ascobolus immersus RN42]|uniref:CFEM domain-containing protein n=1 Tax=Ascobolus immersus RN42 TaxID=1160509 RepID=A0A3N4HBA1_ASCIM|nr:hypothetical protein BJ508DRAFT_335758 [Ascobolus immersus RN42]
MLLLALLIPAIITTTNAIAVEVVASSSDELAQLFGLPPCAGVCVTAELVKSGCGLGLECACKAGDFQLKSSDCVRASCNLEDIISANQITRTVCKEKFNIDIYLPPLPGDITPAPSPTKSIEIPLPDPNEPTDIIIATQPSIPTISETPTGEENYPWDTITPEDNDDFNNQATFNSPLAIGLGLGLSFGLIGVGGTLYLLKKRKKRIEAGAHELDSPVGTRPAGGHFGRDSELGRGVVREKSKRDTHELAGHEICEAPDTEIRECDGTEMTIGGLMRKCRWSFEGDAIQKI